MPILTQAPGLIPFASLGSTSATTVPGSASTSIQLVQANTITTSLATGAALALPVPGSGRLECRRFRVFLSGVITIVTTSATVKTDFYGISGTLGFPTVLGTGTGGQLAVGSYTKMTTATASASLTGAASPGTSYNFYSELLLLGDTISGTLNGTQTSQYANAAAPVDAAVAITQATSWTFGPAVTSTPATVLEPAGWILPAFTFSANHAGTQLQIDNFYLSAD